MSDVAVAMVNVRMERDLRDAGNREIKSLGLTPSEIVRQLWKVIAGGGQDQAAVLDALYKSDVSVERREAVERKLAALRKADESWDRLVGLTGLDPSTYVPLPDDKEALAEARYEYLQEKWGEI